MTNKEKIIGLKIMRNLWLIDVSLDELCENTCYIWADILDKKPLMADYKWFNDYVSKRIYKAFNEDYDINNIFTNDIKLLKIGCDILC